jgi:hypothetical protein
LKVTKEAVCANAEIDRTLTALLNSTSAIAKAVACVSGLAEQSCDDSERAARAEQKKRAERVHVENLPVNRVFNGYILFFLVKLCHDKSRGDLIAYVNDIELRRAEKVIKAIVDNAKLDDATIDAQNQWKRAVTVAKHMTISGPSEKWSV